MLSKTYFYHYRAGSSPATIAFKIDQVNGIIFWDAAFCSDKDFFSKHRGREISERRLEKNMIKLTYNYFGYNKSINIRDLRWKIVEILNNHPNCPDSFASGFRN
jgi:hypothetical protein